MELGRRISVLDPEVERIDAAEWDIVCDARSPSEFAEDRVPGATSTPVLSDEERAEVGTLYKLDAFAAKKLGSALVAANLAGIIRREFLQREKKERVLVYCWRGGDRSLSLAHTLSRIGFEVATIDRGYKGYRAQVSRRVEELGRFGVHIVAGRTGSAKGKLLEELERHGGQVIDLERCADHKGSILGEELHTNFTQPTQKMFESRIAHVARNFDPARPIFVEGESSLIGKCLIPQSLWARMKVADVTEVRLPMPERVKWLRSQYRYFETTHVDRLKGKLKQLVSKRSHAVVDNWLAQVDAGEWDAFVEDMLVNHYDEAYAAAAERDRAGAASRGFLELESLADEEYARGAIELLERHDPAALQR